MDEFLRAAAELVRAGGLLALYWFVIGVAAVVAISPIVSALALARWLFGGP